MHQAGLDGACRYGERDRNLGDAQFLEIVQRQCGALRWGKQRNGALQRLAVLPLDIGLGRSLQHGLGHHFSQKVALTLALPDQIGTAPGHDAVRPCSKSLFVTQASKASGDIEPCRLGRLRRQFPVL